MVEMTSTLGRSEDRPLQTLESVGGGVTAPLGFTSSALHCGIKAAPSALDLAVTRLKRKLAG